MKLCYETDLSVSVDELGAFLGHSGAVGAAEANNARMFGADAIFFVLNARLSTANQIVAHSAVIAAAVVLADRNCYKSVNYRLSVNDAPGLAPIASPVDQFSGSDHTPVYLVPCRNWFGIRGPIPTEPAAPRCLSAVPARSASQQGPSYVVLVMIE